MVGLAARRDGRRTTRPMTSREFRERTGRRAKKAGLRVENVLTQQLEQYYQLLSRWNRKINLTAFNLDEGSDEVFDRLLIEPLAAARFLPPECHPLGRRRHGRWVAGDSHETGGARTEPDDGGGEDPQERLPARGRPPSGPVRVRRRECPVRRAPGTTPHARAGRYRDRPSGSRRDQDVAVVAGAPQAWGRAVVVPRADRTRRPDDNPSTVELAIDASYCWNPPAAAWSSFARRSNPHSRRVDVPRGTSAAELPSE